jgi:hypothetical protein
VAGRYRGHTAAQGAALLRLALPRAGHLLLPKGAHSAAPSPPAPHPKARCQSTDHYCPRPAPRRRRRAAASLPRSGRGAFRRTTSWSRTTATDPWKVKVEVKVREARGAHKEGRHERSDERVSQGEGTSAPVSVSLKGKARSPRATSAACDGDRAPPPSPPQGGTGDRWFGFEPSATARQLLTQLTAAHRAS